MFEHRSHRGPSGRLFLLVALAVALLGGCKKDSPTEVVVPEVPDAPTVTESFTGSIVQDEVSCHFFTLAASGKMVLSLRDLQPLTTLTVGMSVGQPDDARACVVFAQDTSVRLFEMLLSSGTGGLEYCACVADVGNIFPDLTVDYVLEVEHT